MIWNKHSNLNGKHSILSPSNPYWVEDDEEQLKKRITSIKSSEAGTLIHELASDLIDNRIKLTKADKNIIKLKLYNNGIPRTLMDINKVLENLMPYVNDAIGFKMDSEIKLSYNDLIYGQADVICFRNGTLRIHDLKTGKLPAKMEQLLLYASLFYLEYHDSLNFNLGDIKTELRIYQNNEVLIHEPTIEELSHYIDAILVKYEMLINIL